MRVPCRVECHYKRINRIETEGGALTCLSGKMLTFLFSVQHFLRSFTDDGLVFNLINMKRATRCVVYVLSFS